MTQAELVRLGTRLVREAEAAGLITRLAGGVAIALRCPSIETHPSLQRENADVDLIAASDAWDKLPAFFSARGFAPAGMSAGEMTFRGEGTEVEVQTTRFEEDFPLDLSARLTVTTLTLPLADLLLMKLARIVFRVKDIQDASALLVDHRVTDGGDEEEEINREYLYQVVNNHFGLWKTVFDNTVTLEQVFGQYLEPEEAQLAWRRIEQLQEVLDGKPHTPRWWAGRVVGGVRVR